MTKNDYIKIILNSKNEFRTDAAFSICGMDFTKVSIKIDTGCPRTSIPVLKLGVSEQEAYNLKVKDSSDGSISKSISFGVNDSKEKKKEDKKRFRAKRYMELNSISFMHKASGLSIGGVDMGDYDVKVSYDRVGNILIGMDILKELDIHLGTTSNGQTVLLACPRNHISAGYKSELNRLFDVREIS